MTDPPPWGKEREPYFLNQSFDKPKHRHLGETYSSAWGLHDAQTPCVDMPTSFLKPVIAAPFDQPLPPMKCEFSVVLLLCVFMKFSDFILQNYWVLLFYIMMHFEILSPLVLHHLILFLSLLCITLAWSSNIQKERYWSGSQSLARICWFHDGCNQHWHKATDKFNQVQMIYLWPKFTLAKYRRFNIF